MIDDICLERSTGILFRIWFFAGIIGIGFIIFGLFKPQHPQAQVNGSIMTAFVVVFVILTLVLIVKASFFDKVLNPKKGGG